MRLKTLIAATMTFAAIATPAQAESLNTKYQVCAIAGGTLCMGYEITQASGGKLIVNVWDASVAPQLGRINSFALFGLGNTSATLADVRYFNGTTTSSPANDGDWTYGPINGFNISNYSVAAKIANNVGDGFSANPGGSSCNVAGGDCWLTGGNPLAYMIFEFDVVGSLNIDNVLVGFRAQSTNGAVGGSFKCDQTESAPLCGTETIITTNSVPEPSTYALMASGLLAMGFAARRRRSV